MNGNDASQSFVREAVAFTPAVSMQNTLQVPHRMSAVMPAPRAISSLDNINRRGSFVPSESRIDALDSQVRVKSTTLLFCGTVSGLLGSFVACGLGFIKYFEAVEPNYIGVPFESGHNYFPETVSNMCYDPKSPAGKCFFAFTLFASISIYSSWYTHHLRNCYVGNARFMEKCWGRYAKYSPRWMTVRQYVPATGLFLVTCIPTTPNPTDLKDHITVQIHTAGAFMLIGGYVTTELYTILWCKTVFLKKGERRVRFFFAMMALLGAAGFCIASNLIGMAPKYGICCNDDFVFPTLEDIEIAKWAPNGFNGTHFDLAIEDANAYGAHKLVLRNTAHSWVLRIKVLEYASEVIAIFFTISSHLVIWYFCPERRIVFSDTLLEPIGHAREDERIYRRSDVESVLELAPARYVRDAASFYAGVAEPVYESNDESQKTSWK